MFNHCPVFKMVKTCMVLSSINKGTSDLLINISIVIHARIVSPYKINVPIDIFCDEVAHVDRQRLDHRYSSRYTYKWSIKMQAKGDRD